MSMFETEILKTVFAQWISEILKTVFAQWIRDPSSDITPVCIFCKYQESHEDTSFWAQYSTNAI